MRFQWGADVNKPNACDQTALDTVQKLSDCDSSTELIHLLKGWLCFPCSCCPEHFLVSTMIASDISYSLVFSLTSTIVSGLSLLQPGTFEPILEMIGHLRQQ